MIFVPPFVPPVSLGRFKQADIRRICARCTQFNHPCVGITAIRPFDTPAGLWSSAAKRAQVRRLCPSTWGSDQLDRAAACSVCHLHGSRGAWWWRRQSASMLEKYQHGGHSSGAHVCCAVLPPSMKRWLPVSAVAVDAVKHAKHLDACTRRNADKQATDKEAPKPSMSSRSTAEWSTKLRSAGGQWRRRL